jgi:hypothetical protein
LKEKKMLNSKKLKKWSQSTFEFELEECGSNGDCLFYVLSVALSRVLQENVQMLHVRNLLAESIHLKNVDDFISAIGEDQNEKLFDGSLSVQALMSCSDINDRLTGIQALIKTPGWAFPGTDIALHWLVVHSSLVRELKIGFLVFSTFGPGYTSIIRDQDTAIFLLLFNHANAHWQLANFKSTQNILFSSISKTVLDIWIPHI